MREFRKHGILPTRCGEIELFVTRCEVSFGHEIRWWRPIFYDGKIIPLPMPMFRQDVLTTTPGTTFSYLSKSDWDNSSNSVECYGGGAKGAIGAGTTSSGGGGGGGAYTKVFTNGANAGFQFATPGTTAATCEVGAAGASNGAAGGDTWVNDTAYPTTGTNKVGAKGGAALVSGTTTTGGAGGAKASAYTSGFTGAVTSSGGSGASAGGNNSSGGGGGGMGGPRGDGSGGSSTTGGTADAGFGGAGGGPGNPAVKGGSKGDGVTDFLGGGGGGANAGPGTGGDGGDAGGGSGGGGRSNGVSGTPGTGKIVFSWPVYTLTPLFKGEVMQNVLSQ